MTKEEQAKLASQIRELPDATVRRIFWFAFGWMQSNGGFFEGVEAALANYREAK